MTVPLEQVFNIKRYDIISITSSLITGFRTPTSLDWTGNVQYQYFRVLHMKLVGNNRAEVTAQAYNKAAYEAFEVDSGIGISGYSNCYVTNAGTYGALGGYEYIGQLNSKPSYRLGDYTISWSGAAWELKVRTTVLYTSSSAVAFPWLATWSISSGQSPVCKVWEGDPPDGGGGCDINVTSATYSTATGLVRIIIDNC